MLLHEDWQLDAAEEYELPEQLLLLYDDDELLQDGDGELGAE